jgi:hypothetical protein
MSSVNNIVALRKSSRSLATAANAADHLTKQSERSLLGVVPTRGDPRRALSVGFVALASTIAWFGIRINAWSGGTLGGTAEASGLIAGLSVSADVLTLLLPAAARTLWVGGHRAGSGWPRRYGWLP